MLCEFFLVGIEFLFEVWYLTLEFELLLFNLPKLILGLLVLLHELHLISLLLGLNHLLKLPFLVLEIIKHAFKISHFPEVLGLDTPDLRMHY
jgi:hypothetical protein